MCAAPEVLEHCSTEEVGLYQPGRDFTSILKKTLINTAGLYGKEVLLYCKTEVILYCID